ncbi:hypothetical protein [Mangrovicoccus sp. HB161399]|uniref:hypothetical protein n=1 Tax=Mangrovicoccus sp. HB161399 TaxID=2720392 RepID=UPI00155242F9|nr:hypothetical protein [Mangrovicoccus sp. HB161399]
MTVQDWQKVVAMVMESGEEHPEAQLYFLVQRLEACPGAKAAIAASLRDMGKWYDEQADALERADGANVVAFPAEVNRDA